MVEARNTPPHAAQELREAPGGTATPLSHSLWRRVAALLTDMLLLWLMGSLLCLMFFDALAEMGKWGILIGATSAMTYATVLDADGGTFGKRLFGLSIVDVDGHAPGWRRALVRNLVRVLPWFVLDWLGQTRLTWVEVCGAIFQPLYAASFMLVVFDRAHLAVHDRLSRTCVRRTTATDAPSLPDMTQRSWLLVLLPIVVGLVALVGSRFSFAMVQVERIFAVVSELPEASVVAVNDNTVYSPNGNTRTLQITANVQGDPKAAIGAAAHIAATVVGLGVDLAPYDRMRIGLRQLATTGIGWRSNDMAWDRPMIQWRFGDFTEWEQLAGEAPTRWLDRGQAFDVRTWFYRSDDSSGGKGLAYVVEWNDPNFEPAKMKESVARQEAAPVLAYICSHKSWERFSLPDAKGPIFAKVVGVLLTKWPTSRGVRYPHFGVTWHVPLDCPGQ